MWWPIALDRVGQYMMSILPSCQLVEEISLCLIGYRADVSTHSFARCLWWPVERHCWVLFVAVSLIQSPTRGTAWNRRERCDLKMLYEILFPNMLQCMGSFYKVTHSLLIRCWPENIARYLQTPEIASSVHFDNTTNEKVSDYYSIIWVALGWLFLLYILYKYIYLCSQKMYLSL